MLASFFSRRACAGGLGLRERVGDGLLQVGAQPGRHSGDLVGQRTEHRLGLLQAHLPAVAGRDALAMITGAVIGAAVQRVGALARRHRLFRQADVGIALDRLQHADLVDAS
ncbi:hypothetical protein ACIBQ6_13420 [Nonomuraea sp. NPDC049655]|uniref:hypothetical protein n=1 Tax=Nonomuraea sp. NPDC049655 TaxID=3364355 RepID=UPI0037B8D66C